MLLKSHYLLSRRMKMQFYKYEATQNDFILTLNQTFEPKQVQKLCDVHQGIGADGIINIDQLRIITIYNKDGSKAAMCGNGLRCVSHLLYDLTAQSNHKVQVLEKEIYLSYLKKDYAQLSMQSPCFIKKKNKDFPGYFIDVGNLHFVQFTDHIDSFFFDEKLKNFSKENHCNIEVIQQIDKENIKMRVYEYGVQETQSCGSGALACFYLLYQFQLCKNNLKIHVPGGILEVFVNNEGYFLKGPVHFLYKGEIDNE